ncbi:MAG: sulfotransferase [Thermomonas sp.]
MAQTPPEARIAFLVGGVQKAGTSALAQYLRASPGLRLPSDKEAHVFDAPEFDEKRSAADIDAHEAGRFPDAPPGTLLGDATPFYLFHPRCVARIARYNPAMRWIVLLRDPVDRARSHHHMERARGHERLPLWLAILLERGRLRGHRDDFARGSKLRRFSYRARGDYARQLDTLYAHFPREQVLILRSERLREDPEACVREACVFLGVAPPAAGTTYEPVFVGDYPTASAHSPGSRFLRWLMRRELRTMRDRHGIRFD